MSNFKFTEAERSRIEASSDLRIDPDVFDRIEQIVNERDGWIRVEKDSPDPKHEPFLATDGKSIWLSCLTEGGVYVENITGRRIFPTHYKIQSPPKTESK